MKILKDFASKVYNQPRWMVLVGAIVFAALLTGFEQFRATAYLSHVDKYTKSQSVRSAVATADSMQVQAPTSELCDITAAGFIAGNNDAYDEEDFQVAEPINELSQQLEEVLPAPSYTSYFRFLPAVNKGIKRSRSMQAAASSLTSLTSLGERTEYCADLQDVLSSVYFLDTLQAPQGVSALYVGQVESFQVTLARAQRDLLDLAAPADFTGDHSDINDALNSAAINLRFDSNAYLEFSRAIEQDVQLIDSAIESISKKSEDLRSRPSEILLNIQQFRSQ